MLILVTLVFAVRRQRLRVTRPELAVCLLVGIGDMVGNALFAASSRSGLVSLTAVLASLYPIVTVALAAAVLRERIARSQKAGVVLTLTGVLLISS
jgi:drug/metabolite transporter (DMT)-like permease